MNYIGIDIGTSCCKAAVFDEHGEMQYVSSREYNLHFTNDGGAELDSEEVIKKTFEVIKECSSQVEPDSIRGLGISSQGEAFTAIGSKGEILCKAMVSSDVRAQSEIKNFLKKFNERKLYNITGHTAHPLFTLFKLLWLKNNEPELWKQTQYFFCFEDLLQFKLGLKPAISWSLAGRTMMFDIKKHVWDAEILERIGISREQLAKPLSSGKIAGTIDSNIAKELGLPGNTFVVAGGHDQPCCALGAGVTEEGKAIYVTGSVECITPVFNQPALSEELRRNNLCTYDYAIKNKYTSVAYNLTGGNILKWFRDEFGTHEIAEASLSRKNPYEILLSEMSKTPSSLLVLPYFTPSGTPYFDLKTKGAVLGLRLSTKRSDFIRALLEGVTFEMRLNLKILESSGAVINELRSVGGGAKSDVWTQLKSDILNKKIVALNIKEAGCSGAAMLAAAADRKGTIKELAARWVTPEKTFYPNAENEKWYDERFRLYQKLYKSIKKISL